MVAPSMTVAPRVAYLIDSTSGPAEPTRLAATLRAGNADAVIAVAHDERVAGPLDSRRVRELGLEPLPGPLGDSPAQLLGLVRSLRRLLECSRFDWLLLLAADEYPIRPVAASEAALSNVDADALIETVPCPRPEIRLGRSVDPYGLRYHYRWSKVPRVLRPAVRTASALAHPHIEVQRDAGDVVVGVPSKRSPFATPRRRTLTIPGRGNPLSGPRAQNPFGTGLDCYRGSRSCTLSRRAVQAIDRDLTERAELAIYYRDTLQPAESYMHTVLRNDPSMRCSEITRRLRAEAPIGLDQLVGVLESDTDFAGPFESAALDELDRRL